MGRAVGKAPHPDRAPTGIIPQDEPATRPVFVDPSGSRRHRLRLAVCLVGLLLVAALVTIWVSQLSGPAHPPARTPCAQASSAEACGR